MITPAQLSGVHVLANVCETQSEQRYTMRHVASRVGAAGCEERSVPGSRFRGLYAVREAIGDLITSLIRKSYLARTFFKYAGSYT